jgi:hypothetical protein
MAADVGRFIKVSVIANNAGGASTAWLSSARGSIDDYLAGLNPVLSTATATDDGFTFTITNYSASYTFAATTTSGSVSLTGANGVVTGLPANGTATVTVTSSRAGYTTLSTTREGSTVVTVTTTVVVRTTTTTVAATPVVPTTVAVSETPVVTVPQGQASVGTIAPSVGPTTTVLNPMRLQAPQTATTTIPPVVKNAALIPTVAAPEAPAVAPGEAAATADGEVIETTVTRADNQITATAGDVSTSVFGLAADGTRVALNAEGNLVLNEGDKLVVSASGYAPNQDVDAWLYSTPSLLGAMTADGDGKVSGAFNLPSGLDVGDHRLVLSGENPDGAAVLVGIGLSYGTVQSGSTVTRVLIAIPIALAVLFGLFLPAVTRRRKKNAFA